jgi:hypothetical protein
MGVSMNIYKVVSIPGYNTPGKKVLMVNDIPACVCNGNERAQMLIGYIEGTVPGEALSDKKVLGSLNRFKEIS